MTTHRAWTYQRPYRAAGVLTFNRVGQFLWRRGWKRRITASKIMDAARRYTGLSDWGDERFVEPLQVLVDALEDEGRLNPFGHFVMQRSLRHLAANRLWVRRYFQRHPEARDEPVERPLFVVGAPRTGTTLLYNLLSQDAARRPLRLWESLEPAPRKESANGRHDARLARARGMVTFLNYWLAPQLRTVHPLHARGPEECTNLLLNTFVCPAFYLFAHVPSYLDWLLQCDRDRLTWLYEDYRAQLQVLQHQGRRAPWVLKSPAHAFALDALLTVFPDACVVQTQRDMRNVIPSTGSLFAIMRGIYSDDVDPRILGPDIARLLILLRERGQQQQSRHPNRVLDVSYRELVVDPLGTVQSVYRYFGLELGHDMEQRMRRWLVRNPAGKHGVHRYDLQQFGLTLEELQRLASGVA